MNQILSTGNNENNREEQEFMENENYDINNSYDFNSLNSEEENPYNRRQKEPMSTKKIIIIFAICIAVFAIALIAVFALSLGKKNEPEIAVAEPEIVIEEEGNKVKILVTTEGELSKITYYWDENDVTEVNASGKSYENLIKIPNGRTELYVMAEDSTGQISETTKNFARDFDEREPKIKATPYGTGQIKIVATDETSMSYISYRWEDEEEETIQEVENEGDKEITVIIDATRGTNKLYITAVDTSENEATYTPNFQGALSPTIDVKKTKSGKLKIKVSHDKGFKKIEIYVNGEIETYDEESEDYDETQTVIEKMYDMQEGENVVIVVATSLEWDEEHEEYTQKVYSGTTEYEPQ